MAVSRQQNLVFLCYSLYCSSRTAGPFHWSLIDRIIFPNSCLISSYFSCPASAYWIIIYFQMPKSKSTDLEILFMMTNVMQSSFKIKEYQQPMSFAPVPCRFHEPFQRKPLLLVQYKAIVYASQLRLPPLAVCIIWVSPLYNFLLWGPELKILNHSFKGN